jgi:hypothetical protein
MQLRTQSILGALLLGVILGACVTPGRRLEGEELYLAPTRAVPLGGTQRSAPTPAALPSPSKPDFAGVWSIWTNNVSAEGRPWLRGQVVTISWDDLEPSDGQYQWDRLEGKVERAASQGLYVMVLVYGGKHTPEWVYQAGVPRVQPDAGGRVSFPYYLNDVNGDGDGDDPGEFRYFFKRMIDAVAGRLDELNADPSRASYGRILAVQGPVGASGDPHPYERASGDRAASNGWYGEGTSYEISHEQWDAYQRELFRYYYERYRASRTGIHLLLNIADEPQMYEWGLANLRGIWIKYGRVGDRYQRNREYGDPKASSGSWIWEPLREQVGGVVTRSRAEMDLTDMGWFTAAPLWNMYWTQLWGLHTGLDIHNVLEEDLVNPAFAESFAFFTAYAGYEDPRHSQGAWVALRDGLDAADAERFPEEVYGLVRGGRNARRFHAIVRAFAPFGARQDDPGATIKTSFDALNDVGWRIYPGNYEMWLSQIDPAGSSQGLWRVGPKDQPYGRFARRFDGAAGKTEMRFDIDDRFFDGRPLDGAYPLTIRVIYFDEGRGRWALHYDAQADPDKTAAVVVKSDTGRWKAETVVLADGYFGNRGLGDADLRLVSLDDEDDTFHMIEVTRVPK